MTTLELARENNRMIEELLADAIASTSEEPNLEGWDNLEDLDPSEY